MFIHDLIQGLLRRWYFVVACVLATLAFAGYVYVTTPPTYEANASVVLVPPIAQVKEGSNPFLYMGGLEQALAVLIVRVSSPAVANPILRNDPELTYTVARDAATAGPIVRITAEGSTEEATLRVLTEVVNAMPKSMTYLQDELKVPDKVRISVMPIVQDDTAKAVTKKLQRLVLTIVGAGFFLTILATAVLDRILNARKSKKARRDDGGTKNGPESGKAAASRTSIAVDGSLGRSRSPAQAADDFEVPPISLETLGSVLTNASSND
jgi:hypothetical protein